MRVLIVDDHAVIRQGILRLLSDEFPNSSFGEAQNAEQTLEALSAQSLKCCA